MTQTRRVELPPGDWTLITTSIQGLLIQLQSQNPVRLHVGQAKPPANMDDVAVNLTYGGQSFTLSGLDEGDGVYGRPYIKDDGTAAVVVIDKDSGGAPADPS